jgi:hypothetical protein
MLLRRTDWRRVSLAEMLDQHGLSGRAGVVLEQFLVLDDRAVVLAEVAVYVGAQGSPPPVIGITVEQGQQRSHGEIEVSAPQSDEHFEGRIRRVLFSEPVLVAEGTRPASAGVQ